MMRKSNRTIIQAVSLAVFIIAGIFNASYGQAKVDKLDKLISTYAEYGQFNGSVLVADKGKVIYKKGVGLADMEWKFELAEGILYGNDGGYRYKVLPVEAEGEFVNADDRASLVFDTKDKNAITMVLFGRIRFKKVK